MSAAEGLLSGAGEGVSPELPPGYRVVLLNDDFTTMDFVVSVLVEVFGRRADEAVEIMERVHRTGSGVAGVYPFDIAATRSEQAMRRARAAGFPLACTVEPEE